MDNRNALAPGTMLRQYRIDSVIGQGGFGITYLAFDTDLQRRVAIKECFPRDFVSREGTTVVPTGSKDQQNFGWALGKFVGEATTLARFKHPGIVQVLQILKDENESAYMVLEFVEGVALDKWLKSLNGPPPEEKLKQVIAPLLDALEVVHDNGIAHLDIAPDNIYIRESGDAVLLDFGAAKKTIGQQTRTLNLVVKDGYSAPEQYYLEGRQGSWSDVYAFAATLYRAVAGKRPVDAMARLDAINNDEPDPLTPLTHAASEHYTPSFLAAIDQGMAPQSKSRPQSVKDWRPLLLGSQQAVTRATTPAKAKPVPPAPTRPEISEEPAPQRKTGGGSGKGAIAAAIVAVIALAGGGYWYTQQQAAQSEDTEWQNTVKLDTRSGYERFIDAFPASSRRAEVDAAILALTQPWTRRFDNAATERANAVAASGETIVFVGVSSGKAGKGFQAFVQATSLSGRVRWRAEHEDKGNEVFTDVKITRDGDIVVVGNLKERGSTTPRGLIARYAADGKLQWSKTFRTQGQSGFEAVDLLKNGTIVAAGSTSGNRGADGWVVKLNGSGDIINEATHGGDGADAFFAVAELSNGSLALAGRKQRPGGTDPNFWLVKLAADGNVLLDRSPGGRGDDLFRGLAVTGNGELIVVGDTNSTGSNSVDGMIMRLTVDNKLPPKFVAEAKDDFLTDVKIAPDGGIVVAGYTSSRGGGKFDGWVMKYDASLQDTEWERAPGNSGWDTIHGLEVMEDGSSVIVGGSERVGGSGSDVWVMRLGSRGQYDGS